MNAKNEILKKWYTTLQFSSKYDEAFEALLADENLVVRDTFTKNAAENFLSALYQCEQLEQKYIEKGIDLQVFRDTMQDIVRWTNIWYGMTGELGLMETDWLTRHFSMRLFGVGRLQYCFGNAHVDAPEMGMKKGDAILEVHIPSGDSLNIEECKASIAAAKAFYAKHYPEYAYECFTCHSWLLDKTLEKFLAPEANILKFQRLFHVVEDDPSDAAIRFIFRWDGSREKLPQYQAKSNLAKKVKDYVLAGGTMYQSYGVFRK